MKGSCRINLTEGNLGSNLADGEDIELHNEELYSFQLFGFSDDYCKMTIQQPLYLRTYIE